MKNIIFQNDDKSQKIVIDIKTEGDDIKFIMNFSPALEKQDTSSPHYIAFHLLMKTINMKDVSDIKVN